MYYFLAALVSAAIGVTPLFLRRKPAAAGLVGIAAFAVNWTVFYFVVVTTVYPLFGLVGIFTLIWLVISGGVDYSGNDEEFSWIWVPPTALAVIYLFWLVGASSMFEASSYASMISSLGTVEEREWTQDVQPKDPAHMRMASDENAIYQAKKIIGEGGAIGSQFELGEMTVQMVGKELMFVAPLDFSGFSVWMNSNGSPGYVKVSGEDPHHQAELVLFPDGKKMRYTPNACFGDNLERHLRNSGYLGTGLTETTFEIDDDGNPWWVMTAYKPTIGWSGEKVLGAVIVDPFTGSNTFYELGKVPAWVDRVIPDDFVINYLEWQGSYSGGWFNSWWGKKGLTTADSALLIYGDGNQPEWVLDITSTNSKDDS